VNAEQPAPDGADDIPQAVAQIAEIMRGLAAVTVAYAHAVAPVLVRLNEQMRTLANALTEAQAANRDSYALAPPPITGRNVRIAVQPAPTDRPAWQPRYGPPQRHRA
jgi:uncharacterized coiled-coil protein SlyX